jgi:transposase
VTTNFTLKPSIGLPGGCRAEVSRRDVPAEQVGCSGVTAWRRLRDWTEAGVWPQLHEVLPAELRAAGLLDATKAATARRFQSAVYQHGPPGV